VALNYQDGSGDNLYYIVVSGPAVISGIDFNILTFTGAGSIVVEIVSPTDPRLTANGGTAPNPNQPVSSMVGTTQGANVTQGSQSINPFSFIADQVYGNAPLTIAPPATTSGLAVTVTVQSGPATISGDTITITGTGTVVLAADQAGNANYTAAPEVTTSFTVNYPYDTFTTLAGTAQTAGSNNGPAISTVRFDYPAGAAVDKNGNVYIADEGNDTIRKITPAGVVTTLAGTAGVSGSANGTGPASSFNSPSGVAVDKNGNVYVADTGNNTIRVITASGVVSTLAGTAGVTGSANGTGPASSFTSPEDVAVDVNGNVFVADTGNNLIREIASGGVVTTLAGSGAAGATNGNVSGGNAATASFNAPSGVAVDSNDNVYVADTKNNVIREIASGGVVTTLAGSGAAGATNGNVSGGNAAAASFNAPSGVVVDGNGNVYVADTANSVIRKITSAGVVSTLAGTAGSLGSVNGTDSAALFKYPTGVALDGTGNVYVTDIGNNLIREIRSTGLVTTFAGVAGPVGSTDSVGTPALFNSPSGVGVDGIGNTYVADSGNNTVRRISHAGVVTTLAGSPGVTGSTNGTGTAARFNNPHGCSTDKNGNIYIADTGNNTIREITPAGIVTTLAGTPGVAGSSNGTGSAALFKQPTALTVDGSGNIYVADSGNDTIRKITSTGLVTTLAGSAGTSGSTNGMGTSALFNNPSGVAVDGNGNVYVGDTGNDTIREITPAGVVSALAGTAGVPGSADGSSSVALFNAPEGMAVDGNGNVFVVDSGNNTVRKITVNGLVTTGAGTAGIAGSADGDGPQVVFSSPSGLAMDDNGYLYVADTGNHTIREGYQDISLSDFQKISSAQLGQSIALYSSAYGYFVVSGPATISGIDLNIVIFTGTGPVVVGEYKPIQTQPGRRRPSSSPSKDIQGEQPLAVGNPVVLFDISGPTGTATGTSIQFDVTPLDQFANTVVGSSDTFQFSSTDTAAVLPNESTLTAGAGTFNFTFNTTGNQTITVTDTITQAQATFGPITVSAPMSISQWEGQAGFFTATQLAKPLISGPAATPEGDGIPNLLKYFYDINPARPMTATDRAALPVLDISTSGDLTLTFREYALATGITLTVQTSPDLQNWTNVTNPTITQIDTDPNTNDPIMQVEVPVMTTRAFIRLRVTQP